MSLPNLNANSSSLSGVAGSSAADAFVVGPSQPSDAESSHDSFVDRRSSTTGVPARSERRQFGSSHYGLTDEGRELALAIDQYKIEHHRRYLTCDEMLAVVTNLGYRKN
jgi:hypothetical protein